MITGFEYLIALFIDELPDNVASFREEHPKQTLLLTL
jgi:hypothetical protein